MPRPISVSTRAPRALVHALLAGTLALGLVAACGGGNDEAAADWSAQAIALPQGASVRPVLVNTQVGVGESRLIFGLFEASGALINEATGGTVRLYHLEGDRGSLVTEQPLTRVQLAQDPTPHKHPDGSLHLHEGPVATVYGTTVNLPQPEWWGADVSVEVGGKRYDRLRLRFFAREHTDEPAIGDGAPRTRQTTLQDEPDIKLIDSSAEPNPALHDLTIAEAVTNGKPSVIGFATPAFCQTRFCGPVVDQVVAPLHERYGTRVNVLHVEPYDLADAQSGKLEPVPAMLEWGLQTEPWVFVVGRDGRVVAKFEGIMSIDEVTAAVERALAGGG